MKYIGLFCFVTCLIIVQAGATVTVRQTATAAQSNQTCTDDDLGNRTCTPASLPATLTLNFAPTSGGNQLFLAGGAACTDNLGQNWIYEVLIGGQWISFDGSVPPFLSEDPIGLAGGINKYAYVGDSPVNYRDSSGLCRVVAYFRTLGSVAGVEWSHAYILTTDVNGTTYFGAFPSGNGPSSNSGKLASGSSGSSSHMSGRSCSSRSSNNSRPGGWGQLVPQYGPYTPDVAGNDYTTGNRPSLVVLDDGSPCDASDAALTNAMNAIRDANISYDPFFNNSNAAAGTALRYSGLNAGQPPIWAPGWGNNLLPTRTTGGGSAF